MGRLVEAVVNISLLIFAIVFVKLCLNIMPEIAIYP